MEYVEGRWLLSEIKNEISYNENSINVMWMLLAILQLLQRNIKAHLQSMYTHAHAQI